MSATDELRRLLDERGVEYRASHSGYEIEIGPHITAFANPTDTTVDVSLFRITPEQAINATLGNDGVGGTKNGVAERGTCHIVKTWSDSDYDEDWRYRCSECGCFIGVYERDPETGDVISADNYCPNCGRRVVE